MDAIRIRHLQGVSDRGTGGRQRQAHRKDPGGNAAIAADNVPWGVDKRACLQ